MSVCHFCKKPAEEYHNYCGWQCMIEEAKQNGGKVHTPNNLPVRSIDRDGNMWEHEHGDHPDYKFPVDVVYCGPKEDEPCFVNWEGKRSGNEEMNKSLLTQTHALIYCDGYVVVTLYEHCYAMWQNSNGANSGGSLWKHKQWKLSDESLKKIRERWPYAV